MPTKLLQQAVLSGKLKCRNFNVCFVSVLWTRFKGNVKWTQWTLNNNKKEHTRLGGKNSGEEVGGEGMGMYLIKTFCVNIWILNEIFVKSQKTQSYSDFS